MTNYSTSNGTNSLDNEVPEKPNWIAHVGPIFIKHAREYPHMRSAMEMACFKHWVSNKYRYRSLLSSEQGERKKVTKLHFLSDVQRKTVKKWIEEEEPLLLEINTPQELKNALQTAIEVEFATLPPYLTAMFSIIKAVGSESYDILYSVMRDEMKHFATACNMLVSIGGTPVLNTEAVVPKFPGPLPGGLRPNLTVHLEKLSVQQVYSFMRIEKPQIFREPYEKGGVLTVDENSKRIEEQDTIGQFYEIIKQAFITLTDKGELKYGHEDLQTSVLSAQKIEGIDNVKTGIDEIILEGEGGGNPNNENPGLFPKDEDGDLAHYYKYSEIYYGKKIVTVKDKPGFSYSGDAVSINTENVYDFPADPDINKLSEGSPEYEAALAFAKEFKSMLDLLQLSFTKSQSEYMGRAIGKMHALADNALPLMQMGVGTSFQLPPADSE